MPSIANVTPPTEAEIAAGQEITALLEQLPATPSCVLSTCQDGATCYGLASCAGCGYTPNGLPLCDRHTHAAEQAIVLPCPHCSASVRIHGIRR